MRGVIFDFNGTMVFDEKFHVSAWRKLISDKTGYEITDEEYQDNCQGIHADVIIKRYFKQKMGDFEIAELINEKEENYRRLCIESGKFKLVEGLEDFLNALKKNKIPCTIATSAPLDNVKFYFDNLNLENWFDFEYVVYNDGTLPGKPEPDIFLKAAEVIGVEISDCTVFEDSRSGIKAAKHAGTYKIMGITSTHDKNHLLEVGADMSIANYKNLNLLLEFIS